MKYYIYIYILTSSARLMSSETVVTVMPFSVDHGVINSGHHMNEHIIPTIHSLDELKSFIENNRDEVHSLDYIKQNVQVIPKVFAEYFLGKHSIEDEATANLLSTKITGIMENMLASGSDDYYQHILNLIFLVHKPISEGSTSFRRPSSFSTEVHDQAGLLNAAKSLEGLLTETLAKDNQDLEHKKRVHSRFAKIYQILIAGLTIVSIVVPVIQQYIGDPANNAQSFSNCSHV